MSSEDKVNLQHMSIDEKFKKASEMSAQIGVPFTNPDGSYRPLIDVLHDWARFLKENTHD